MGWRSGSSRRVGRSILVLLGAASLGAPAAAIQPKEPTTPLDYKEFSAPELYISSAHVPLADFLAGLSDHEVWEVRRSGLKASGADPALVWVDPRSGAVTNLIVSHPLIPGSGRGNRVGLHRLRRVLGRPVTQVDEKLVADAALAYLKSHEPLLGIDLRQLGPARAAAVHPDLWQVRIPQVYKDITVRRGRVVVTISHGNVVMAGTEFWGDVSSALLDTEPISDGEALERGFAYVGGRLPADELVASPQLEIVPVAPLDPARGQGAGYGHRLVWTFTFRRPPDLGTWEVMVDAHSGELLVFADRNQYVERKQITGAVYPATNTGNCPPPPTPSPCGRMQGGWPMPFADTGLLSPDDFTNGAGVFEWPGGAISTATTLSGRYVEVEDQCGAVRESSRRGDLDLGGQDGDHDCASAGASKGNTAASRTAFYEINKVAEMARGWLPGNKWLKHRQVLTRVNLCGGACNAHYDATEGTVNFQHADGICRNTGEIATVIDHEWGHALDDNDAIGDASITSEAYADIAAIYRQQISCVGYGIFHSTSTVRDCGTTADGSNADEDPRTDPMARHCDVDCPGYRDADSERHVLPAPDTPAFACEFCRGRTIAPGPCGALPHCDAAPSRQAAWDLVARDLQGYPPSLDSETAFLIGNRLFYHGSGNIGLWHACDCAATSFTDTRGCGAANAYLQWLAADDDNGDLSDGTPHMTAIFKAFERHGIACPGPKPRDRGCAAGPKNRPTLTVVPRSSGNELSWSAVPGAARYWVFRTEGHAGCHLGKTRIAEAPAATRTYTDKEVAGGRSYYYNVVAAGRSESCFGPVSVCVAVTAR